jgi:hypothetical protein
MVCPKCKTVTERRREGKWLREVCRNRACARYGQAIKTVLEIREVEEQPQDAKTTDDG